MKVAILGLGYRSEFFIRALNRIDGLEIAGALVRRAEAVSEAWEKYQIKAYMSKEDILSLKPDFIVNTVSKKANTELSIYFASNGIPVLQETPVGIDLDMINKTKELGHIYQIAEQYQFYTYFKNVRKMIDSGMLGDVREMSISYAHDYHGISIIRHCLGEASRIRLSGIQFKNNIARTNTRYDKFMDGIEMPYKSKHILIEWDDIRVIYDFNSEEYRSTIRNPYFVLRGSRGEIINDTISYLDSDNNPTTMHIDGFGTYDDNEPIYEVLCKMVSCVKTGIPFYPLEYATQDAELSIIMNSFDEELKTVTYKE